jgi:hypothetical protein
MKKVFCCNIKYNITKLNEEALKIVQEMQNKSNLKENLNWTNKWNRSNHLFWTKAELIFQKIFNCQKSNDNFSDVDFVSADWERFFDLKTFNTSASPEIAKQKRYKFYIQKKQIEKHKENLDKTFIICIY